MKRNIDIVPLLRPSRRPTVRPALRLAVALAVVVAFMALLVEQPASAQTTVTLVSNTGQTDGGAGSLHLDHAQAFTTGNNSAGYKLTGIDLKLEDTNDSTTTIEITIHESSSDLPGTSLGTLTKSGSLADNAVNSWTTSTGIDLAASTTYFMVVNGEGNTHTNDGNVQNTASDSQDSGGASGWSISDTSLFKALAATTWSSWHQSKMIAVKGYAKTSTNTAPGAPTGLTAFATGQTQINLSWTAPSSNGGAAISGYKIEVSTDGTTWTDLSADTGSTTTTYSHSGLTAGSTRHYRVSAINSIGTGTASGTAMETANVLVGNAFQSGGYFRNAHALPHAQAFTTGAEGAYLLTGIDVVSVDPQGDDFTVNIHATSGGLPTGSSLATLTAPSGTGAFSAGRIRFTAPDNTLLDPNTTYTVVVARDGTGDVRISASLSDNEDAGKASGFSIANTSAFYSGVAWALDNMNSLALQIAVRGEATSYTPTNVKIAPGNGQRMTMYWDAGDPSNLPDRFLVMYGSGGFNWCYTGQSNCPTQTHGTLNYNDGAGESSSGRAGYKSFSPADAESGSAFGYEAEFPFTSGTTIDANRGLAYNRVCGVKGDGTSASHYHCSSFLPNVTSRQNYDLSWSSLVRNTGTGTIAASWTGTGRHNRIVLLFKSGTQSYPEIADDFSATADVMVGGKPVAGYRVLSGSATSYTFGPSDALDASIDYTFTLRPYASASHLVMNDSAERSATDVTPPGAPTGLAAQATGQTRIHLSWTAPTQAGSTAISGYRIEVSTDGSAWTDLVADTGSTDTTYADTGLTAGSTRHYRVSAINSAGTGTVSGTATETADVLVGNVFQGSDGSATLANQSISTAFTTGSHTQGYTVTAIEVISEDADGDDFLASIYNTNDSGQPTNSRGSLIVSGADFNAARIRLGVRERHQTLAANTTYAVVLLRNGTENVTLDTTASDDEDAGKASGFSIADVSISGMVGGSWSNLANSEAVRIAVRGEARTGNPPGKPTALAAVAPGVTQINLSWTAPTDAGTTAITGYRIEVSTDGSTWTDLVADTGSTAITYAHTELTAGSTRHYRVSAINDFGAGAASDTATETSNVLVGNALQSATTGITVTTLSYSQGFTTGGNSGGYTLNAIEVVSADTEGDDFTADLYATSSGLPTGSSLASLTAPTGAGAFSAGRVRFTAPANTTLTANTTYAVVVARDGSGNVDLATLASDDEDAGKASGFSIANQYGSLVGNWAFFDVDPSLHIAVRGEAKTGNNAPVFSDTTVTRSFDENTAAGEDVGAAVEATDADTGDTVTYTLGGTDAASFDIVSSTGQIQTKTGVTYDFEAKSSYSVTVTASDGTATATATVTINVNDVEEPPSAPAAPTVSAVSGSTTSLSVSWTAPTNTGKPDIASYDLQYRQSGVTAWTDGPQDQTGTSATISSLAASTTYEVQVRATNDEGDSPWSSSGSGATNAPTNNAPVFSDTTVTRSFDENTAAGEDVGAAVEATDADSDDLTYTLGGTDEASFDIVSSSGQIQTRTGVTYDFEAKSSYSVTVTASDGTATATATVTINVNDVEEPPSAPAAPTVSAVSGSTTSLSVSWTAPTNTGKPAIASYDLQYRQSGVTAWTDGPQDQTGTSATISSLTANTTYEVQVRATNDEGDSAWSSSGSGATNAPTNNTPVFSDTTVTRSFDENTAAGEDVGAAVEATDEDTGDTVTYTLGGTDAASFDIVSSSGQIQTKTGVTYDFETKSSYSVTVTASDGTATATATVTINVNDVEEPPSAPAAPTVSAVSGSTTSLSVSWTAPTNTGKPAIASYDLQYRQSGVTAWTDGPQDQTGTSATISSLTASTTYEVQVRATNDEGDSPWSSSGSGTTGNTTPTLVPSAPRDLRTVAAFSQISLSWDTPAHLGQSVTGYRIEAAQEGGAWTALVASQTARTYLHANLTPGSSWRYRVTALNQVGAGPVSAVVTDTANVLVSNSEWRNRDPGGTTGFRDPSKAIQLFTTGGEAHGYTLASVEVTRWGGWGRFSMEIWGARSSSSCSANCRQWPDDDDVIARLDGPTDASATTPGRVVFTAPANTHLEPNTTYAVAMIPAAGDFLTLARRQGTADDPDAAGGWSVGDRAYALRPVHFAPGYERYEWYNNSAWPVRIRGAVNPGAGESPANAEATGAPGITGAARVGEELSAGTSGISDSDGMERATFSYQWLSDGSEIAGATAQTYTVAPGDAGAVLSVRVSFTDDAGNEESLTSEPTAAVVDDGLTLASATVDGASLTLTFTELLNELVDPPETAFTVTVNGTAVTVSEASVSGSAVTLTLATAVAAGDTVTVGYEQPEGDGAVGDLQGRVAESFSGREVANNTSPPPLTASSSQVPASHDGSAEFTFELHFSEEPELSYVTLRDHAFAVTGGSVLNARRLNPPSDLGWEITVRPSGDGSVTLTLPATTDCAAAGAICTGDGKMLSAQLQVSVPGPDSPQESQQNSPATGAPTISGTAQVGQTLTVSTTGIADADGLTNVSYTYQWLADDAEISGATGSTYTLVAADQGKEIKARVSFTDDAGNAESLTSAATPAVAAANSPATGAPAISGTAQVGETLTVSTTGIADADGLTNVGYNYQWLADDAEISGATGSTYTLASGDRGKAITARVSFTDDAGNAESLTSAATAAVAPPPLTASVRAAPASHDGSAAFTFELHFSEEFELSYVTLRDHAFTVTGGSIVNARRLNPPSNLGWEITVEPSGNGTVVIVLPPTTDCAATGAICTDDGRKLSNRLEVSVPGPDE